MRFPPADYDRLAGPRTWCVLVKTRNGHVSMLHGLTANEAKKARDKLAPWMSDMIPGVEHTVSLREDSITACHVFDGAGP